MVTASGSGRARDGPNENRDVIPGPKLSRCIVSIALSSLPSRMPGTLESQAADATSLRLPVLRQVGVHAVPRAQERDDRRRLGELSSACPPLRPARPLGASPSSPGSRCLMTTPARIAIHDTLRAHGQVGGDPARHSRAEPISASCHRVVV